MATKQILNRGDKLKHISEALEKLGLDSKISQARDYIKYHYGYEMSESPYYNEKNRQINASKNSKPQIPSITEVPKTPKIEESKQDMGGILELVDAGKRLIKILGKESAKELIDKL